ncbi:MAG: hypothetical protein QF437_00195 [Planctomycetota bacterium]|jgi:hypothetical protein|nr:hypothetical protein [Planctomycetota bacterium]MDP7247999.1 hypothetical protein [Planctomycetota bacterium]|tara:strand:+ start:294 stop:437 length:144 start_codon:yes stop_codon:yes gene_type:complete
MNDARYWMLDAGSAGVSSSNGFIRTSSFVIHFSFHFNFPLAANLSGG